MKQIVVVGGGMCGLFLLYQITKQNLPWQVVLLEKEVRLGGRVKTVDGMEAGAGRFQKYHFLFQQLISELGLRHLATPTDSTAVFYPSDGTNFFMDSVLDYRTNHENVLEPAFFAALDVYLGKKTLPCSGLVTEIVLASKFYDKKYLQNTCLDTFAKKIIGKKNTDFIKESFGFYTELVTMNAWDACRLFLSLNPSNEFFVLRGGLSQVTDAMVAVIQKNSNIQILLKHAVIGIEKDKNLFDITCENGLRIKTETCICATEKEVLEKLSIFRPIRSMLQKIECGSLCRIYSVYSNHWFRGISKFTTNNDLRMVIPFNKKILMTSYSDNHFADSWKRLYDSYGEDGVEKKIKKLLKQSLGMEIPTPQKTMVFYWKCGVGYWMVGADSHVYAEKIQNPMPNLFVCGENVSENHQQWMEGALETGMQVLETIKNELQ